MSLDLPAESAAHRLRPLAGGPGSRDLQFSDLETRSLAAFGQVVFKPTAALELSGGLRYTEDRKRYQGTVLNLFPSTRPDPDPLPTKAIPEGGPLFIYATPFEEPVLGRDRFDEPSIPLEHVGEHVRLVCT